VLLTRSSVIPLVNQHIHNTCFSLSFIRHLSDKINDGVFPAEEASRLYSQLVTSFLGHLDISKLKNQATVDERAAKIPRYLYADIYGSQPPPVADPVTGEALCLFLASLFEQQADDSHFRNFAMALVAQADKIPGEQFHGLWLPFVRELIPTLERYGVPESTPRYTHVAGAVLDAYVKTYLGDEPSVTSNLRRERVGGCACSDCRHLNSFLEDESRYVLRFPCNKARRLHLHRMLDYNGSDCTHETDRSTNPNTLVISKTNHHVATRVAAWKNRKLQVAKQLLNLNPEKLRLVLGRDDLDRIMSSVIDKWTARPQGQGQGQGQAQAGRALGPANTNVAGSSASAGQAAGSKRKHVSIVDLTNDDD
jgi:hypothetical protein